MREIARLTEERLNSVRRELDNLATIGIILAEDKIKMAGEKKEKKKYYTVNVGFVLYQEFKNLILKSKLLLEKSLANEIKRLGKVKFLVLSGVFVDDNRAKTDMLIVGRVNHNKLKALMKKLERSFDQELRYTTMDEDEFNYRNQVTDKFLFEVLEGKKIVVVDEMKKE